MKTFILILSLTVTLRADPPVVNIYIGATNPPVQLSSNATERVYGDDIPPGFQQTNYPMSLRPPSAVPLSVQMRYAAQLARGKSAPWTQRFIVTHVEERALTRAEDNEVPVFSTNFVVTVLPVSDETNAPVTWGPAKNRSIRFVTTKPTKKGDEFELFPLK